jgi:glycosyltransferase involved in cell wall biosynthesis
LIPAKGLPHLFEAMAEVRAVHPTIRFLLYGDGPPRPRAEVRASAERWGLDPDQVFAGIYERAELPSIMAAADIFVLSSLTEGFPLAVVEAMACGRAIVATAVGGIPDLLQDGVTGILCPAADAASLARALCRLIEHAEERTRLGRAAREAYERGPYHPDHAVRHYLAMYAETMRISREDLCP